eukprot:6178216-Pleurochrysis_carterae.AAC.1
MLVPGDRAGGDGERAGPSGAGQKALLRARALSLEHDLPGIMGAPSRSMHEVKDTDSNPQADEESEETLGMHGSQSAFMSVSGNADGLLGAPYVPGVKPCNRIRTTFGLSDVQSSAWNLVVGDAHHAVHNEAAICALFVRVLPSTIRCLKRSQGTAGHRSVEAAELNSDDMQSLIYRVFKSDHLTMHLSRETIKLLASKFRRQQVVSCAAC